MPDHSRLVLATVGIAALTVTAAGSVAVLADGAVAPDGDSTPVADTLVHADPATTTATATHTVDVTLGDDVPATTTTYDRVVVDYGASPSADTSGVTAADVVRAGVDRRDELYRPGAGGGDDPGTQIDRNLTVTAVEPSADGTALVVTFAGELDLHPEDELVLIVESVDNPASAGNATVAVTIESGDATLSGTDTVTYRGTTATPGDADETGGPQTSEPTGCDPA